MKKSLLVIALLAAGALLVLPGCTRTVYVQAPPPSESVTEAPPAAPSEVMVASPGPAYVWVPGYWSWQGRWLWIGGRWMVPPRPHTVWIGGHWVHRRHGYVWIGGYWR